MIFISSLPLRISGEDRLEKIEFKKFPSRGSENLDFCDISSRGMKRPHEMIHPISKLLFSTSAVEKRAGAKGKNQGIFLFTLTSPKPGRQQTEAKAKQKQKSNKEEQSQDFPH